MTLYLYTLSYLVEIVYSGVHLSLARRYCEKGYAIVGIGSYELTISLLQARTVLESTVKYVVREGYSNAKVRIYLVREVRRFDSTRLREEHTLGRHGMG